jgi:hypothetical protein
MGKPYLCFLFVKDGIIRECRFENSEIMESVAEILIGCRHMPEDMGAIFKKEKLVINRSDIYRFF